MRLSPRQQAERHLICGRDLQPRPTRLATPELPSGEVHQTVRSTDTRVVRSSRHDGERHRTGKGNQELETGMEDRTNRKVEFLRA